ncbi:MAG: type VI secretion system protein ImpJ [Paraglaciecola sp.]|jgi:type VI secretion system protein ImpJ
MTTLNTLPRPVHWFEGMLLSPQHFQQNHLYFDSALFNQLQRLSSYYWGLCEVQFNQHALADNQILIEKLHGVMKDGTVVNYGIDSSVSQPSLSLNLSNIILPDGVQEFEIHLAIAEYGEACASDANSDMQRYDSINVGEVLDDNDADNNVDLVRLRTRLKLMPFYKDASKIPSNYSHFPIARVKMGADDSFDFVDYIPPLLFVKSDVETDGPTLYQQIDQCLRALRKKATQLKQHFIDHHTDGVVMSNFQKQRIHYLTRSLPKLDALLRCETTHPYTIFQELLDAAGNMAVLHEDLLPPVFDRYQHHNIQCCFKQVFNFIDNILENARVDFSSFKFQTRGDQQRGDYEYFCPLANIKNNNDKGPLILMLACKVKPGVSRQQVMDWIEDACIFTEDQRKEIEKSRETGAQRKQVNEFTKLKIGGSEDEVLVEATLQLNHNGLEANNIIITGSNRGLEPSAPHSITWFIDDDKGDKS